MHVDGFYQSYILHAAKSGYIFIYEEKVYNTEGVIPKDGKAIFDTSIS